MKIFGSPLTSWFPHLHLPPSHFYPGCVFVGDQKLPPQELSTLSSDMFFVLNELQAHLGDIAVQAQTTAIGRATVFLLVEGLVFSW